MSFLCCLTMSMLGLAWSDELEAGLTTPTAQPRPIEKCLTKPICCSFKDVSLQEACEWFQYLMSVNINIDDDAMQHARGDEGRHVSLVEENVPFQDVLEKLLKPMGLAFEVTEKGIHIKTEAVSTPVPPTQVDDDVPYSEEQPGDETAKKGPTKEKLGENGVIYPFTLKELKAICGGCAGTITREPNRYPVSRSTVEAGRLRTHAVEVLIERELTRPISVNFQKTPLETVCRDLQNLTGINIVLDKEALAEANVGLDQPMSLNVEHISAKSVLNLLLKQVDLTYEIKDDALVITSEPSRKGASEVFPYVDLLEEPHACQVAYPVADLIVPADEVTPVVCKMLHKPFQFTSNKANNTLEGDLIELITKIDPDSWESHGGAGKIQYFPLGMQLVVVNTKDVQKKVADLLANLRKLQDVQDKEYSLEMKLVAANGDGEPKEIRLPKVTMMQGRWFTMFQGKTVTLKDGNIQDLLAAAPEKAPVLLKKGSEPPTKKAEPTDDDVMVGVLIRGKVTTLAGKLVRLDLMVQKNELDSATKDDIVVIGNSIRSAQRIQTGETFNHVLSEDEDGTPLVWLEVRVTTPSGEIKPPKPAINQEEENLFRGIETPIPRP